jgi:hypothetical protein
MVEIIEFLAYVKNILTISGQKQVTLAPSMGHPHTSSSACGR